MKGITFQDELLLQYDDFRVVTLPQHIDDYFPHCVVVLKVLNQQKSFK